MVVVVDMEDVSVSGFVSFAGSVELFSIKTRRKWFSTGSSISSNPSIVLAVQKRKNNSAIKLSVTFYVLCQKKITIISNYKN